MEFFLLFGLIFVGGLLIGLDLAQKPWWHRSSSSSFRRSKPRNPSRYSIQVKHSLNTPSPSKQPHFRHSLRQNSAKESKLINRSQPEKSVADYIPTHPLLKTNSAKAQGRINHLQKRNPDFKQTYRRRSQWDRTREAQTELSSPQAIHSGFEPTLKAPKQPKWTEPQTELSSPQAIHSGFEPTLKRSQRTKPDKAQVESRFPQQTNVTDSQPRIQLSRWTKLANYRSGAIFPADKSN